MWGFGRGLGGCCGDPDGRRRVVGVRPAVLGPRGAYVARKYTVARVCRAEVYEIHGSAIPATVEPWFSRVSAAERGQGVYFRWAYPRMRILPVGIPAINSSAIPGAIDVGWPRSGSVE